MTLFTLSAYAILRLGDPTDESAWQWAWFGPPPKSAPPRSPVHLARGLGWQAIVEPSALLYARVMVDGRPVESPAMQYVVKQEQRVPVGPIATHDPARAFAITMTDGSVLFRQEELVAYHWPSHSLRFQPGVLPRAREQAIKSGAGGVEFQLRLGRESLYSGTLTTYLNSRRYAGVALYLDSDEKTRLEWNPPSPSYHAPAYATASDPRAQPKLKRALIEAKLLLQ